MRVHWNGEEREVPSAQTLERLLREAGVEVEGVAVAVDGEVVPRSAWAGFEVRPGCRIEVVRAVAGGSADAGGGGEEEPLCIAGRLFRTRLFLGTGKYPDAASLQEALRRSRTEMVTVAMRYYEAHDAILPPLDGSLQLLPNTAGATTAEEAIHIAQLARAATGTNWVKLEVIGDPRTLWPDVQGTVEATARLAEEGFVVLPYTSPDPVVARRLAAAGAAAVMPLAAPIGSGMGLVDWQGIARVIEAVDLPVVVDAGLGSPADAAAAMELGADAVLVNTAIARSGNPGRMAEAFYHGVVAGRLAHLAGLMPRGGAANPSSPTRGVPRPAPVARGSRDGRGA